MKRIDSISKTAALMLVAIFLSNDVMASSYALMGSRYSIQMNFPPGSGSVSIDHPKAAAQPDVTREVVQPKAEIPAVKAMPLSMEVNALEKGGIIGPHPVDPLSHPYDDVYTLELSDEQWFAYNRVALKYKVRGMADGQGIGKIINGKAVLGSMKFESGDDWVESETELDKVWLQPGINHVTFTVPQALPFGIEVRDVRFELSNEAGQDAQLDVLPLQLVAERTDLNLLGDAEALHVYRLNDVQTPAIPRDIINVTRGGYAYRVEGKSQGYIVGVGIDQSRIPAGHLLQEVKTFYFNYQEHKWIPVAIDSMATEGDGKTNYVPAQQGSEYFNGIIKTPEMPEAAGFVPTTISDIKAADPSAEMTIIQPPGINKNGDASLSYPLTIPAGRNGMQPSLALTYSSEAGTGWVGMGWNIGAPQISVDTRWGVPSFPATVQDEVYVLNGTSLTQEGGWKGNRVDLNDPSFTRASRTTGDVRFFEPTMSEYKEIHRNGNGPTDYVWREVTADQTTMYYGTQDGSTVHAGSVLTDANGNIVKWMLRKVEDKWGNYILYDYQTTTSAASGMLNGAKCIRLKTISYTGHTSQAPMYEVEFVATNGRADATVSMNYGFKVSDEYRLNEVVVTYDNSEEIKRYKLHYGTSAYGKTLLDSVAEYRSGKWFYRHSFEYNDESISYVASTDISVRGSVNTNVLGDIFDEGTSVVRALSENSSGIAAEFGEALDYSPVGSSLSLGYSGNFYLGLGVPDGNIGPSNTIGGGFGFSKTTDYGRRSLADMNGDGLVDLVKRTTSGVYFYPGYRDENGVFDFDDQQTAVSGISNISKSVNSSNSWNLMAFVPGVVVGMNTNTANSNNYIYLQDVNGDGLTDVVDKGVVKFNQYNPLTGSSSFGNSSLPTPNPILKGTYTDVGDPSVFTKLHVELVKTWKAPFAGVVNISMPYAVNASSDDGVEMAIQHNSNFSQSFFTANPGSSGTITKQVTVQRGDIIMFRTRSKTNGYKDHVATTPAVNYLTGSKLDPNNVNYGQFSSADGFILSEQRWFKVPANLDMRITWNNSSSLSLPSLTDTVEFIVHFESGGNYVDHVYRHLPYQTAVLDWSDMTGQTFLDNMFSTNGMNITANVSVSFEVRANSNVNWQSIPWRPNIEVYSGSSWLTAPMIPHFAIFNDPLQVAPSALFNGGSYPWFRITPDIPASINTDYFASGNPSSTAVAYLTVKASSGLIAKYRINFVSGTTTILNELAAGTAVNQSCQANHLLPLSQLQNKYLWYEFFTDDPVLADLLKADAGVNLYQLDASKVCQGTVAISNFSVFTKSEMKGTGPDYLGWGQIAYMKTASAIDHQALINLPSDPNDVDLSGYTSGMTSSQLETLANSLGLNTGSQNFGGIVMHPVRSDVGYESYFSYISSSTANHVLDRWEGPSPYTAVFKNHALPGYFGELPADFELTDQPAVVDASAFAKQAPPKYSVTKTRVVNTGVSFGGLSYQESESVTNVDYRTLGHTDFIDINGDRYPDVVEAKFGAGHLSSQVTNPLGAYASMLTLEPGNPVFEEANPYSTGVSTSFSNEDIRFLNYGFPGFSDSKSEAYVRLVDMNGDGLPDRWNQGGVRLGTGSNFLASAYTTNINGSPTYPRASYSEDHSVQLGVLGFGYDFFSAQVNVNTNHSETKTEFADVNGDGLVDCIDPNNTYVLINQGTDFVQSNILVSSFSDLRVNDAASAAIELSLALASNVFIKVATKMAASGNLALNRAKSLLIDIDRDGILDRITYQRSGPNRFIHVLKGVRTSGEQGPNLLKKVNNPLGGSFDITYELTGNKYGKYPCIVHDQLITPREASENDVYWDMPESKWVMASVTVNDGYDLTAGSVDVDGVDSYTTYFAYDGGIYNRREREFLGFTKTQTSTDKLEGSAFPGTEYADTYPGIGTMAFKPIYREIVNYLTPEGNSYEAMKDYRYQSGLVDNTVKLILFDSGGENPVAVEHIAAYSKFDYRYYKVVIDPTAGSMFNRIDLGTEITDFSEVGEMDCLYPYLGTASSVHFMDLSNKYYYTKHEFQYDTYGNIRRVIDNGNTTTFAMQETQIGTIPANPNPIPVMQRSFPTDYTVRLIAIMNYYAPDSAASRTNQIKRHRIYEGDTINTSSLRLYTKVNNLNTGSQEGKAPRGIMSFRTSSTGGTSNLTYDTYGNVTSLTGPAASNGDRVVVNYTYDTEVHQYVTNVARKISATLWDESCMLYDIPKGLLKQTLDINGQPMVYTYDDFYRVSKIFAPNEVLDQSAPYTIRFTYFPQGANKVGTLPNRIPVAVTYHNLDFDAGEHLLGVSDDPIGTCGVAIDLSGRSGTASQVVKTATFMDGLARVVQVKKESTFSTLGSGGITNSQNYVFSGMTGYDNLGRVSYRWNDELVTGFGAGTGFTTYTHPTEPEPVSRQSYEVYGRPAYSETKDESGVLVQNLTEYGWGSEPFNENIFEVTQIADAVAPSGGSSIALTTKSYFDPWNRLVLSWSGNSKTFYNYNAYGQLTMVTDPMGIETTYKYDLQSHVVEENHADRGLSTGSYDNAGNLTSQTLAGTTITYGYSYGRKTSKSVPTTGGLNNVTYTYGKKNDGRNGAGRIVFVEQGDDMLDEGYAYDNMGNVVLNYRRIAVPLAGERAFQTRTMYDSWGRTRQTRYPDSELLTYDYHNNGELKSIQTSRTIIDAAHSYYVKDIGYNGFGQQICMKYGNDVITEFDYNEHTRRLTHVDVETPANIINSSSYTLLNKDIVYNKVGNITSITNDGMGTRVGTGPTFNMLGADYTHNYQYDANNRLIGAQGAWNESHYGIQTTNPELTYDLSMEYDLDGRIVQKDQDVQRFNYGTLETDYILNYTYQEGTHKIDVVNDNGNDNTYYYNNRGGVTRIEDSSLPPQEWKKFSWNENDHLRAAYNIGGLHHYVYDHTGERLMKSTLWDVNISGNGSGGGPQYVLDPYIVYVGPHMVVRFYADTLEVTNHYYMGAQRIASRPYGATPDWFVATGTHGDDSGWEDPASPFGDPPIENNIVLDEILPIIEEFQLEWEFDPNEAASNGLPSYSHQWFTPDWCEVEGEYYANMSRVLQYWCDCIHESYRLENPEDCANHEEVYWYHPDYLGSTEYVTDLSGLPNEHYFYSPFGEALVAEQAWYSDNSTPYLFNSKEVDPETGLHYYGARYYDSRVSMWMSVDPMASERSWLTPYNFVQDNPAMLWDPTGMLDGDPGGGGFWKSIGNWFSKSWNWMTGGSDGNSTPNNSVDATSGADDSNDWWHSWNEKGEWTKADSEPLQDVPVTASPLPKGSGVQNPMLSGRENLLLEPTNDNGVSPPSIWGPTLTFLTAPMPKRFVAKNSSAMTSVLSWGMGKVPWKINFFGKRRLYTHSLLGRPRYAATWGRYLGRWGTRFLGPVGWTIMGYDFSRFTLLGSQGFFLQPSKGWTGNMQPYTPGICFARGTIITMGDGSLIPIEEVEIGDSIMTFSFEINEVEVRRVIQIDSPRHDEMVKIDFSNGVSNTNTPDHPYFVKTKGWSSCDPIATSKRYSIEVGTLGIGDTCLSYGLDGVEWVMVVSIDRYFEDQVTYNLSGVEGNHNFFANGVLVHNKLMINNLAIPNDMKEEKHLPSDQDRNDQFDDLVAFIKRELGNIKIELTEETDLENALGITGEDGRDFIQTYSRAFNVDVSGIDYSAHFYPEPSLWVDFKSINIRPITIGDLVKGIKTGTLTID